MAEGPRWRRGVPLLGSVPLLLYLAIFLLVPTITVLVGALTVDGSFGTGNLEVLRRSTVVDALANSLRVAGVSAVVGAVAGALLAYALVTGRPDGLVRRTVTSVCAVLAQFGGVTLAFAFLATLGLQGTVSVFVADRAGLQLYGPWLFESWGLTLVYCYFQIPLMVVVFLPALDGIRPTWREAAETLGASTARYWRHVGVPLLLPAFVGSLLLLFANAFSAYATAAALVTQGSTLLPLEIRRSLGSDTTGSSAGAAFVIAMVMVVVVAVVMTIYSLLLRRGARWLQ